MKISGFIHLDFKGESAVSLAFRGILSKRETRLPQKRGLNISL